MSGICGELRLDGRMPEQAQLQRMLQRIERRGPEGSGHHAEGPVALGHQRLTSLNPHTGSSQPVVDLDNSLALVFDGVIYNHSVLRRELQKLGQQFSTTGDAEVILKAYVQWGEHCVEHLHGAFAFAIWNGRQQTLFLARDRLGVKPLYYSLGNKALYFASNTAALLVTGDVDTRIDPLALHHQLTLHAVVPAPRTLLNGIRKLAPGHTLTINPQGVHHTARYWKLNAMRPAMARTEDEWCEEIYSALMRAIHHCHDTSEVSTGVLLSGGLDSSLIVALLAEQGVRDIQTFSIGFEDVPEEKGSEFEYSDLIVERYGTNHHKYIIANDQVLQRLPEAVMQMAEPMVGQDAVAFYLLAEQVSRDARVVLSGQGADEVFAGYFWYPRMVAEQGSDLERFARHYFDRPHSEYLETVAADYRGADHTGLLIQSLLAEPGAETFLDRVLRLDVTTLIVDDPVKRVDNMTMAWGLEARVPFLDHELVELAMQLPAGLKLPSGGKHLLKKMSRSRLPEAIIDRPKGYFPMPALKYVRGPFLEFMREILDSTACRQRGLFHRPYVEKLLAEPEQHFTYLRGSKLWHLALLELWLQHNVDGAGTGSS